MTIGGIVLGVLNIAIVVAVLLLLGLLVQWGLTFLSITVPQNVQRGYVGVVALVALYMLVALVLGMPSIRLLST